MTDYVYTYGIEQFPNEKYDLSKLDKEIRDSSIVVSLAHLSGTEEDVSAYFRSELDVKDWATLSGVVSSHDGEPLPENATVNVSVQNTPNVSFPDYVAPYSGRLMVHQTSRKPGLTVHWTSRGDKRCAPNSYGTGNFASHHHKIGDPLVSTFYLDFNTVTNETWMHEVILTWKDCMLDRVSAAVVTDAATFVSASGTSYASYGDMIVPTYPGYGNMTPASDFTSCSGGLVYMPPPSDPGIDSLPGLWDADWSSVNSKFENVAPNLYGTGEYNLFYRESTLNKVLNDIALLGSGFQIFNSSDTDQLGHGMRLKVTFETIGEDHEWACSAVLVMHRQYVVDLQ